MKINLSKINAKVNEPGVGKTGEPGPPGADGAQGEQGPPGPFRGAAVFSGFNDPNDDPWSGLEVSDMYFRTDSSKLMYVWNGSSWVDSGF